MSVAMRLRKRHEPVLTVPAAIDGASIVVVDDNAYIHMAVSAALPTARITEAWRVHELRAVVERDVPRAIVTSSRLPDGSGFDAIGELRASPQLADAVVVALTSAQIEWETVEAVAAGADAFLAKDGDYALLAPIIDQLLELAPEERARRRAAIAGSPIPLVGHAAG